MVARVKGTVIRSRRTFVVGEFSENAWQNVLQALPEADRERLSGPLPATSWQPFDLNERLDAAIVEVLGHGDPKIFEIIGAWSAKLNLGGPHSAFIAHGDPARLMEATSRVYDFYYDAGYRTWETTGPTSGVMTTYDAQTFSEHDCLTVIGWYKEALRMCGASSVRIEEVSCRARKDAYCRYNISWETETAD